MSEDEAINQANTLLKAMRNASERNLNSILFEAVITRSDIKAIETILDLYKQEKEKIEAMNKGIDELVREKQDLKTELYMNSVSKDKIRAKIKELEDECDNSNAYDTTWYEAGINALKELLEEE